MRTFTYDAALLLKDSVAVTAGTVGKVGGANKIFDTGFVAGGPPSLFKGVAVIDITAIKTTTGDELYTILIQGSNSATFASGVENLAVLDIGASAPRLGTGSVLSGPGRYELIFQNEQADVQYQYLRTYTNTAGTLPSITHTLFVGRDFLAT